MVLASPDHYIYNYRQVLLQTPRSEDLCTKEIPCLHSLYLWSRSRIKINTAAMSDTGTGTPTSPLAFHTLFRTRPQF